MWKRRPIHQRHPARPQLAPELAGQFQAASPATHDHDPPRHCESSPVMPASARRRRVLADFPDHRLRTARILAQATAPQLAGLLENRIGGRAEERIDAAHVADDVQVQRAGFDRPQRLAREAVEVRCPRRRARGRGSAPSRPAASARCSRRRSGTPKGPGAGWRSAGRAGPRSPACRPRRTISRWAIFLSRRSRMMPSRMSPTCSRLIVSCMISDQRAPSFSSSASRLICVR